MSTRIKPLVGATLLALGIAVSGGASADSPNQPLIVEVHADGAGTMRILGVNLASKKGVPVVTLGTLQLPLVGPFTATQIGAMTPEQYSALVDLVT